MIARHHGKSWIYVDAALDSRWTYLFFSLLAAVSFLVGFRHVLHTGLDPRWPAGLDFQWRAASLFAHGHDPWIEALQSHRNLANSPSVPNYLHELYVLYLPLTLLSERTAAIVWSLLNILLSACSIVMLGALLSISRAQQVLLFLALAASVSFRDGLGVGQFCFVELFLFCAIYRYAASPLARGLLLGLSFAKYSFSPVLVLTFLFKRRLLALCAALLPALAGLLIAMRFLHKPAFPLAIEPLLVARHGVSPGFADLMTLAERVGPHTPSGVIYALALAFSAAYAARLAAKRTLTPAAELACVTVASLLLFKHLIYDYVFLVIPLAYAVWGGELKLWARWTVLGIVGYVWFGVPLYIAEDPLRAALPLLVCNCLCTAALLISLDAGRDTRHSMPSATRASAMPRRQRSYTIDQLVRRKHRGISTD